MCGIVGYIGDKQAYPILINGLKRLEYRGYDSAGVSILNKTVKVFKKKGKYLILMSMLQKKIHQEQLELDIPDGLHMVSQMM